MKIQVLELIKHKKHLFNQNRLEAIRELEKLREKANKDFNKDGLKSAMQDLPLIKTKLVSAKTVLAVLIELEKEINELQEPLV
jgi:hypothetical protein